MIYQHSGWVHQHSGRVKGKEPQKRSTDESRLLFRHEREREGGEGCLQLQIASKGKQVKDGTLGRKIRAETRSPLPLPLSPLPKKEKE